MEGTHFTIVWKEGRSQLSYYGSRIEAERSLHRLLLTGQVGIGCRIGVGHKRTQELYYYGSPKNYLVYLNEPKVEATPIKHSPARELRSKVAAALSTLWSFSL